jgi:hypothetical protein
MKVGNRGRRGRSLQHTEFQVETTNQLVHQSSIGDRSIAIGKGIGKLLQSVAAVMRYHLALDKIVEFALQMDGVAQLISCKKTPKVHPDLMSSGTTKLEAHIKQIFRYRGVEPVTHEEIVLGPLKILRMCVVALYVMKEVEAT